MEHLFNCDTHDSRSEKELGAVAREWLRQVQCPRLCDSEWKAQAMKKPHLPVPPQSTFPSHALLAQLTGSQMGKGK